MNTKSSDNEWRRLALQFDGHRMAALGHLRCLLEDPVKHREVVEKFLAAPPLSGAAVLAQRIKSLAAEQTESIEKGCLRTTKATIPDVLPLARAYVAKPGNSAGGALHVVLEDKNVRDDNVDWCLKHAIEIGDVDAEELARQILRLSRTQRLKLSYLCWNK